MQKYLAGLVILIAIAAAWYVTPRRELTADLANVTTVHYQCAGEKTFVATFATGAAKPPAQPDQPPIPGGSVTLKLSDGRTLSLAQTLSADGSRYANEDESFVFWSVGSGATIQENGSDSSFTDCVVK